MNIKVIDTENKEIFNSVREASMYIGLEEKTLGGYLNKTRKNKTSLIYLSEFEKGDLSNVKAFIDKSINIGDSFKTNQGQIATVIEVLFDRKIKIMFNDEHKFEKIVHSSHLKKGKISNPFFKSIYGVGYIGDNPLYPTSIKQKPTKCYATWKGMMDRCYSYKAHKTRPFYKECSVDEIWHSYSNFCKWFDKNYKIDYMEGWHLDKDLIVKGNKIYSPETCCFVPNEINSVLVKQSRLKGGLPLGVSKSYNNPHPFRARHIDRTLGYFDTPEEAFQSYKETKELHIKGVADKWKGKINNKVYEALYNYEIEITD